MRPPRVTLHPELDVVGNDDPFGPQRLNPASALRLALASATVASASSSATSSRSSRADSRSCLATSDVVTFSALPRQRFPEALDRARSASGARMEMTGCCGHPCFQPMVFPSGSDSPALQLQLSLRIVNLHVDSRDTRELLSSIQTGEVPLAFYSPSRPALRVLNNRTLLSSMRSRSSLKLVLSGRRTKLVGACVAD